MASCLCCRCSKEFPRADIHRRPPEYCPECKRQARREASRRYEAKFPDRANAAKKRWVLNNSSKKREIDRRHYRNNYREGSQFQISVTYRNRVREVLRGEYKSARTLELLGCSFEESRRHIEKQFRPGMTWENYGPVWHIDHVRPCASFDLSDPVQQRECFHYSNLQPLFAQENREKSDKWVK